MKRALRRLAQAERALHAWGDWLASVEIPMHDTEILRQQRQQIEEQNDGNTP